MMRLHQRCNHPLVHHPHLLQPLAELALHVHDVLHPGGQVVNLPAVDLLQHIPANNRCYQKFMN